MDIYLKKSQNIKHLPSISVSLRPFPILANLL